MTLAVGSSASAATAEPVAVSAAVKAAACATASAKSVDAAGSLAVLCDTRVEVLDERTPWASSYVLPSGESVLEVSAVPTRTEVNGSWEPVDTSIVASRSAEGLMDVAAPVARLQVSGGDTADTTDAAVPLGTITSEAGQTLTVGFPLPLPQPTVDGNRATYALHDGVRVVTYISPSGMGFTPVIELDDPEAATWFRDALAQAREDRGLPGDGFEIPLSFAFSDGLTARALDDGTVQVTDDGGNIVFQAPPAYMWDSSGALPIDPVLPGEKKPAALDGDRAEWAWPGDVVAQMPVRLEGSALVLSPDESVLDAEDTSWPVHIDPGFSGHGAADWTMLRTGGYTSSMYRFTDLSPSYPGGGVGRCVGVSSCGVSYYVGRLVWQFTGLSSIAALVGSDIDSATLSVYGVSSYNCNAATTELWHTAPITSASTWSTLGYLSNQSSNTSAQRDGCAQGQGWRDFNALGMLRLIADVDADNITMGLKASDESSMAGWKRFRNDAKLAVTYNRPPTAPTNVRLTNPVAACVSGTSRPAINTATPTITGTLSDPDGGTVYPSFQVFNVSTVTQVWAATPAGVAAGSSVSATVSPALSDGVAYGYRIKSNDGAKWSNWSSPLCEFTVDTVKPVAPTVTAVSTGMQAVYLSTGVNGGVGRTGLFTLSRGTSTDVTQLRYKFSTATVASTVTPDANGNAQVTYAPPIYGPVTLTVDARDAAGNWSNQTVYAFTVAAPKASAVWLLDDGAGTVGADTSTTTPANPLTISGATWTDGALADFGINGSDRALAFAGTTGYATAAPAVDTSAGFAVSARVWLDATASGTGTFVAVSQDGASQSAFTLGYKPGCAGGSGCWSFGMADADTSTATVTSVDSAAAAQRGRWMHLVGEYNTATPGSPKLRLWVCDIGNPDDPGDLEPVSSQQSRSATPWKAFGSFTVGRAKAAGTSTAPWRGKVDDIQVIGGPAIDTTKVLHLCQEGTGND
ncbi:LamG-like jellyroll fold domain-containing protein [Microbacterium sp.]|uniref:LamG-like jellyroll fold domain-containing protein n=1 Tax=Microbacterium sp. TaxID=51671 RepID=UPI0039E3B4E5